MINNIVLFIFAVVLVIIMLKILGKSLKIITLTLFNAIGGALVLYVLNLIFPNIFEVNIFSSIIVGFLGVPGILLITVLQIFLF